jgi:hypothetical protein
MTGTASYSNDRHFNLSKFDCWLSLKVMFELEREKLLDVDSRMVMVPTPSAYICEM